MPSIDNIKVSLTNYVLEMNNLEQVFTYLQESIGKDVDVAISDYKGTVYAKDRSNRELLANEYLNIVLKWEMANPYFYDQSSETFWFKVGNHKNDGFIFVRGVSQENCSEILETLEQASLAVKTYLNHTHSIENVENSYAHNFLTDVLLRNINIKEIIRHNYPLLNYDLNNLYYVSILVPHRNLNDLEKQALHSYSKDWLKNNNLDIYCTFWANKYLVFICPTHYDAKILDVDVGWKKHIENNTRYHEDVRKKFGFQATMGMGDKYVIDKLHRSYQEALFALHLSELTGYGNRVRHIYDLGVFSLIFSNDVNDLKSLSSKYLNSLIVHDKMNNSMFLDTLRHYFDSHLNVNETAERLYLHINTLRYRLKRIEELTNTSLQSMNDRMNLYIALKVYDVLGRLELIEYI